MTKIELKEIIASLLDDVFIEMLMEDKIYDGKSLNEIASEIHLL